MFTRNSIPGWISYTPALTAVTTNPDIGSTGTALGRYRPVDDSIEVTATITFKGTGVSAGTGHYIIGLPTGLSIDSSKLPLSDSSNFAGYSVIGKGFTFDDSTEANRQGAIVVNDNGLVKMISDANNSLIVGSGVPFTWAADDVLMAYFTVPIAGW